MTHRPPHQAAQLDPQDAAHVAADLADPDVDPEALAAPADPVVDLAVLAAPAVQVARVDAVDPETASAVSTSPPRHPGTPKLVLERL